MDTKRYRFKGIAFKDQGDDAGSFSGVFSTLNVVDADGDLTLPGAFGEQRVIISGYGHASWREGVNCVPVGKGRIFERGEEGIVEGRFFLDTQAGLETYKTVKNIGDLQEFSYALPEIDSEMRTIDGKTVRVLKKIRVNEVSPVLMGSGVNTRLLDIKSATKRAFASHSTPTDDAPWSAATNEARVKRDEAVSYYRRIFAWQDPDGDVGNKGTYKFIHHLVSADGEPGAASTRACSAGIAVLNGGRGGANIPDSDRQGVWKHLAAHLRDADKEPPELRSLDTEPRDLKLVDHIDLVRVDVEEVIERLKDLGELREEQDKHIGAMTMKRARELAKALEDLTHELGQIQRAHDGMTREYLRFLELNTERVRV